MDFFSLAMSPGHSPTSRLSLPIASGNMTVTQDTNVRIVVCQNFGQVTIYLSTLIYLGADESLSVRESWQLVTAIHGEDDGLTLCE
jgi:hypothetical protein